MKKFVSFALFIIMTLAMPITAFAQTISDSGNVTVTYTFEDSYTVTIPDSMTIGTPANVSASDVRIGEDQVLNVIVSSAQYNDGWQLSNGTNTVEYTLKIGNSGANIDNNGIILSATAGEDVTSTLHTAVTEVPTYPGEYTDTLTFSVVIANKNISQAKAEELVEKCEALLDAIEADATLYDTLYEKHNDLTTTKCELECHIMLFFIEHDDSTSQEGVNKAYAEALTKYNELKALAGI